MYSNKLKISKIQYWARTRQFALVLIIYFYYSSLEKKEKKNTCFYFKQSSYAIEQFINLRN